MRIAIADDDPEIIRFLSAIIKQIDHECVSFNNGDQLARALMRDHFDLIMLDWHMPDKSGMEMLKWIKTDVPDAPPIVMMTGRTAKRDITDALNAGADDYITKPEDENVIAARIKALLRGSVTCGEMEKHATYGHYELNRMDQSVVHRGKTIILTAKEFELADLFFRNRDRTLARAYIMETIWRTSADLATRTLDMHISRVRSKLELKAENGFRLCTVFGYGYRLESSEV
jgi:DNA-binding response OmpR family regulator